MAVHHVDVDPITALFLDGSAFGAEIGEIRTEDGSGNFDPAIEIGHVFSSPGFTATE
jgi:hypothetical protein